MAPKAKKTKQGGSAGKGVAGKGGGGAGKTGGSSKGRSAGSTGKGAGGGKGISAASPSARAGKPGKLQAARKSPSFPVSGDKRGGKPKRQPRSSKAPFGRQSTGRVKALESRTAAPVAPPNPRRARQTAESLAVATAAIDAALDKKALLPVLIDVSGMASYTDFIAIVSGRSDRQVDAIAEGIHMAMKARGRSLLGQEGTGSGRWTLLDYGDVVFHVFYHPVREFYDLESLWVDAPRVPLRVPPEAVMAQPDALYGNL